MSRIFSLDVKKLLKGGVEMGSEFKNINNLDELKQYLLLKGRNHRTYRHYTNKEGLLGMLTSKKLHLTSLASTRMNDLQEGTKNNFEERKKLFEISFAFGESENMAMWGLYSLPFSESLCLSFTQEAIRLLSEHANGLYEIKDNKYIVKGECHNYFINDVVYASGIRGTLDGIIRHGNEIIVVKEKPQLQSISSVDFLTGFVKNMVWSYENEVRFIVKDANPTSDKIAIDIPDGFLNNMIVTFAPWAEYDFKTSIKEIVQGKKLDNIKFHESKFEKLVNYRKLCDYCEHGVFRRRA